MCQERHTVIEHILYEQQETNRLLRALIRHEPISSGAPRDKVREVQKALGVSTDGIIGPETTHAFNKLR